MKNQFIIYLPMCSLHRWSHDCQDYCCVLILVAKLIGKLSTLVRFHKLISSFLKFTEHFSTIFISKFFVTIINI